MNELESLLLERKQLNNKIKQYLEIAFKEWLLANITTLKLEFVSNGWSGEHLSILFYHDFNLPLLDERIIFEEGQMCDIQSSGSNKLTVTFYLNESFVNNWLSIFLANPKINETFYLIAF